jgi:sugar-specific transcriptional regulator TrmB
MSSYRQLKQLGLSNNAIALYSVLVEHGAMGVSELAECTGLLAQGLYRLIATLEERGFVIAIGDYPKQYQARPLASALDHYLEYQRQLAGSIMPDRFMGSSPTPHMRILVGRAEIIDTHLALIAKTKHELMTISIGKKVPEKVYQAHSDAVDQGVKSYLIFQQHTAENDMRLRRWKSQGSHVRVLTGEGYHLHVVDTNYAILSATDTTNTKERVAVLISAPKVVAELRKYFFERWQEAKLLNANS